MKQFYLKTLALLLMSMAGVNAFAYDCEVGDIYYNLNKEEMTAEVTFKDYSYNSYFGDIVIPESITYSDQTYSVTSIVKSAFAGCTGLTSIIIGNGVTTIGNNAFSGCTGLTSITIPESVTTIGNYALYGCTGLTSITIGNGVTSIGQNAFEGCTGLTRVIIPDIATWCAISFFNSISNPLYYAKHLFSDDNTEVKDLVIPDGVTGIENSAFCNCTGLTSVVIPNSVTSIGTRTFWGCTGLTRVDYSSLEHLCSIDFGDIYSNPLYYARHLYINDEELKDNLVLPESVTSIDVGAFNGCILKNVMLKHQTPPTVHAESFSIQTRYHATLYVPAGTWEDYAYDEGWYTFINIRETATEEAQLSSTQSYTLMDAQKFAYLVYDPVNDAVSTVASTGIDENNPNHCWQTLTVEGQRYLYNIGARRFAVPSADGLVLTDKARSLSVTDGKDGLLFDNQTDRQWAMVVNEKMTVDTHAEEAVTTAIALMKADPSQPVSTCYGVDGRRQSTSQRGLNILRMSDGTVRKVMERSATK